MKSKSKRPFARRPRNTCASTTSSPKGNATRDMWTASTGGLGCIPFPSSAVWGSRKSLPARFRNTSSHSEANRGLLIRMRGIEGQAQCRLSARSSGVDAGICQGRRGYHLSGDARVRSDPLAGIALPVLDIFMFAALFLAEYFYRHRSAVHKRLMLLVVTGALMPSPVAHVTGHFAFTRGTRDS